MTGIHRIPQDAPDAWHLTSWPQRTEALQATIDDLKALADRQFNTIAALEARIERLTAQARRRSWARRKIAALLRALG